jgi:hypothetical protein
MIQPLSRFPNAQKATSYGRINAHEGREQRQVAGQIRYPADETMISPWVLKVNISASHLQHLGDARVTRTRNVYTCL